MFKKTILIVLFLSIALTPACSIFGGNGDNNGKSEILFKSFLELFGNVEFWMKLLNAYDTWKVSKKLDSADRLLVMMVAISPVLQEINSAIDKAKLEQWKKQIQGDKTVPPDFEPLTDEAIQKLKGSKLTEDIKVSRAANPDLVAIAFFSHPELKSNIELSRNNETLEKEIWGLYSQLTDWENKNPEQRKQSARATLKAAEKLGVDTQPFLTEVVDPSPEGTIKFHYEVNTEDAALNKLKEAVRRRINITIQPWRGEGG